MTMPDTPMALCAVALVPPRRACAWLPSLLAENPEPR